MDPFRGPGGGSQTLAALAAEATADVPRQSELLTADQRTERLELAAGVQDQQAGNGYAILAMLSALVFLVPCTAMVKGGRIHDAASVAMVLGGLGVGVFWFLSSRAGEAARRRRSEAVARMLAWPDTLPFPAEAYAELLVADQPLLDVILAVAPERRVFVEAVRAIDAAIDVEALGDTRFRLQLPPRSKTFTSKHSARLVRFGDRELIERLFQRLLVPLHQESGVQRVLFGGTIEVRN